MPWMTSSPNSSGMRSRDFMAYSWSLRVRSAPRMLSMEPTSPFSIWAILVVSSMTGPVAYPLPVY